LIRWLQISINDVTIMICLHTRLHTNGNTLLFKTVYFDMNGSIISINSNEIFYNPKKINRKLNDECMGDEDYEHAHKVWSEINV
jgi:hypothetical protein